MPLPPLSPVRLALYGLLLTWLFLTGCVRDRSGQVTIDPPDETSAEETFSNPIYEVGPDPWVYRYDSSYYVTYTTGRNVTLIETPEMSELNSSTARSRVVWTPPDTGFNSAEIWAPELHRIDGRWYVYYAASNGHNETHRMWVLSNPDEDPLSDNWQDLGELELPDDRWAIDGTPVEIAGRRYFAWSGWEGEVNVSQHIYLAAMDSPVSVSGERVKILEPTTAWERNNVSPEVTEGPQFLARGGRQFLFYSAGGCWTDGYSIGALWLEKGKDPLVAANWTRVEDNPLFTSNPAGHVYGPGHNSFFTSPDGSEDWMLYHANANPEDGCGDKRSMRMQQIRWTADGFPDLGEAVATGTSLAVPAGE